MESGIFHNCLQDPTDAHAGCERNESERIGSKLRLRLLQILDETTKLQVLIKNGKGWRNPGAVRSGGIGEECRAREVLGGLRGCDGADGGGDGDDRGDDADATEPTKKVMATTEDLTEARVCHDDSTEGDANGREADVRSH